MASAVCELKYFIEDYFWVPLVPKDVDYGNNDIFIFEV